MKSQKVSCKKIIAIIVRSQRNPLEHAVGLKYLTLSAS